jgi:protein SCO1
LARFAGYSGFAVLEVLIARNVSATTLARFAGLDETLTMHRFVLASGLIATLLAGCGKPSRDVAGTTTPSPTATNEQVFQVKGQIVSLEPDGRTVKIRHEEIPGYMPAMTMPFEVKTTNDLAGLMAGDTVSFRMIVTDTDGWIENLKRLNATRTNSPPVTGQFRLVRDVEQLATGDALPEYHFVNQDGQKISTSKFRGGPLAINFLFTRCPFPTFCPLMANNFAKAQQQLLAMIPQGGTLTNWHLLSISFDPQFDTPSVLKAYAARYNYDPSRWTFATGELIDVTAISEQFGMTFWHDEGGSISHNLRTVVIDAKGLVQTNFIGNEWTADELVAEMVKAAAVK